jgi:hypothetical protein
MELPGGLCSHAREMRLLHDRDELFALVEQLVGLAFSREGGRVTSGRRGNPPVVLVAGGRGMGKTAVLDEIEEAYGNRAPRVRLDIAHQRYSPAQPGLAAGGKPLLIILKDLKWELEMRVRPNGRLRFPRLRVALLAIETWQPGWDSSTKIDLDTADQLLRAASKNVAAIAHDNRTDWAKGWVTDVLTEFSGTTTSFPVDIFVRATVRAFLTKTLNSLHRRAPIKWHEEFDTRAPGDGYQALVTVGRDWHLGGEYQARAEQVLAAALLADLSAGYSGGAWLTRAASPLVLLDNVNVHPAGRRFLRLVLDSRARAGAEADPLVIVATSPEEFFTSMAASDPGAGPKLPASAALRRVGLTPLGQADVLDMLNGADPHHLPPGLAHLIRRLTGGLPLGVHVITRAVAFAAPEGSPRAPSSAVESGSILDLPVPGKEGASGAPVASHLLRLLIPDEGWRARLAILACARNADEAQALVDSHLAADEGRFAVSDAEELLRANGWESGPDHFVGDPFLRTLLLHKLGSPDNTPSSAEVHSTLRDHHGGAGTGLLADSEPLRLYHCLALGEVGYVTRRLHESFAGSDAESWLETLYHVACVPYRGRPDHRRSVALGGADDDTKDVVYRSVGRLLHAAWYLNDPLVAPDTTVIEKLADELKLLAGQHTRGNTVLSQAARTWPAQLHAWQQAYDPPARGEW